eukprot:scaffold4240_cov163-Amphora_coffeaeformis.AAC.7
MDSCMGRESPRWINTKTPSNHQILHEEDCLIMDDSNRDIVTPREREREIQEKTPIKKYNATGKKRRMRQTRQQQQQQRLQQWLAAMVGRAVGRKGLLSQQLTNLVKKKNHRIIACHCCWGGFHLPPQPQFPLEESTVIIPWQQPRQQQPLVVRKKGDRGVGYDPQQPRAPSPCSSTVFCRRLRRLSQPLRPLSCHHPDPVSFLLLVLFFLNIRGIPSRGCPLPIIRPIILIISPWRHRTTNKTHQ